MRPIPLGILAVLTLAAAGSAQFVLTTSWLDNNGCDANFFDLEGTGGADCLITQLDINTTATGDVEVWWRPGTFVGFESSSAGWTQATITFATGAGGGVPTPVPLTTPFLVPAGQRVAVYVATSGPTGGSQLNYINGSGTAGITVQTSDTFLTVYEGAGECAYFGGGGNRPRNFSGAIHYNPGCIGECVAPLQLAPTITGLPGSRAADDTVMVDTTACGLDTYTPACGGSADEIFVHFTAPFDGTVIADTCGAGTTYDTVLAVAEGPCGALVELACNDDTCGTGSEVTFTMVTGTDYRIVVDGVGGATGDAELRVQMTEVPTDYLPCPIVPNAVAVANPRAAAVPGPVNLVPSATSSPDTLGNVAYIPCYDQYYTCDPGNASFDWHVFDAATGAQVSMTSTGIDGRSSFLNPTSGYLEALSYDAMSLSGANEGYLQVGLDVDAYHDGMNVQLLAPLPGLAGDQTAAAYDYDRDVLYSRQGSDTVAIVDPATGLSTGTITLDSVSAGSPTFSAYAIAYTGVFQYELAVGTADAVVLFDLNGTYQATVPLGVTVTDFDFTGSYVNDLWWTWDGTTSSWLSFEIFDATVSLPCSTAAGGDLILASGPHTIDTDTGDIDAAPSAGFDPATGHFNFNNIDIQAGAVVTVQGTQPLALLALGDIVVDGDILADGFPGMSAPCGAPGGAGGAGGPGGFEGGEAGGTQRLDGLPGLGPGGGSPGIIDSAGGGGGGFAAQGGAGAGVNGGAGGPPYAFLLPTLSGGSGGGGASGDDDGTPGPDPSDDGGGGGGGGGGAVLLSANGTATVNGTISARGGDGGPTACSGNTGDGGGGSGGYIAVLAPSMPSVSGTLDVTGGNGHHTTIPGGDGSDGRTYVDAFAPNCYNCTITGPTSPTSGNVPLTIDVLGGTTAYDATFDFSTDAGATYTLCTPAGTSTLPNPALGLVPGTPEVFIWDTATDGLSPPSSGVIVRASVDDGTSTANCETTSFDIDCACGDCNSNGTPLEILDALVAAQISAGLSPPAPATAQQELCCDATGDSSITILDALRMAQGAAGLPVSLDCP
jgi:hypothetical protein